MQSNFALEQLSEQEQEMQVTERFNNFLYMGREKEDILINVKIVDRLPKIYKAKDIFVTYHFQDGRENWRLTKKGNTYIYRSPLENKKQVMVINRTFDKVTAYLLPNKNKGWVWDFTDIIYDFLQVLLINYFALRKSNIFVHSIGLKDLDGKGLLFAGKSGAGKSTIARLWHKYSKAMVLNDDRIIVSKVNGNFFIHSSPWHGAFSDYLKSHIESAPLNRLFFISHSLQNKIKRISEKEAFNLLYPTLFPTFWDKGCLENIVLFCQELVKRVPCYMLGFVNDINIIRFVRKIKQ